MLYVPHRRRAKYWGMRDGKDEIQSLFVVVFNFETHGSNFQIPTVISYLSSRIPSLGLQYLGSFLRPLPLWDGSLHKGSYRRGDAAFTMG